MLRGMVVDDTMSNLTSTVSNEASISSSNNRNEFAANLYYQQQQPIQSLASPNNQTAALQQQQQPPPKKKRSLPGHPDPDAEVVALSPRALMATNRFVCEICNKGFQRDQNLQLHRRGHNLPWKLKQRNNKEVVKKKVYVCPEPSCVHHDPSRALGDLTGVKKHFSRKHGEKKWKCDKCSKRYAVQSDWKAHSKICGTREYRCDCGTLFSRRDSFITHRAFCDALAEESSRSMTHHTPLLSSQTLINVIPPNSHSHSHSQSQIHGFLNHPLIPNLKQEISCQSTFNLPPWLSSSDQSITAGSNPLFSSIQENPNPTNPNFPSAAAISSSSSLMSATALLQKASQMGVTMSSKLGCQSSSEESILMRPHHHVGAQTGGLCAPSSTTTAVLPSREAFLPSGLAAFGNNKQIVNVPAGCMDLQDINIIGSSSAAAAVNASASTIGFDHGSFSFEDTFNGMMNQKRNINPLQESSQLMGEGLTRDFLGLRAFPTHRNFHLDMDGLDQMGSSSYDQQPPWQT